MKTITASEILEMKQEYSMVYDEVDFISSSDWKSISAAVVRKYSVSTEETNPNVLFRRKKNQQ